MDAEKEPKPEISNPRGKPEKLDGCSRVGVAIAGFTVFWVIAFVLGRAGWVLLVTYIVAAAIVGVGLLTRPGSRSFGIGILLGLSLAVGLYLLLLAICGGKGY